MGKSQRLQGDIHCRRRSGKQFTCWEMCRHSQENGEINADRQWSAKQNRALATCSNTRSIFPSMFCTRPESVVAKMVCEGFFQKKKKKDTPKDSFAPRAREGSFVGVSAERSKTILVQRRNGGVIELEPVTSYVEMSDDESLL